MNRPELSVSPLARSFSRRSCTSWITVREKPTVIRAEAMKATDT